MIEIHVQTLSIYFSGTGAFTFEVSDNDIEVELGSLTFEVAPSRSALRLEVVLHQDYKEAPPGVSHLDGPTETIELQLHEVSLYILTYLMFVNALFLLMYKEQNIDSRGASLKS